MTVETLAGTMDRRPPVLALEGIGKDFTGLKALDSLTLEIADGEIFGIMGPNGAGKTTLINIISGFLSPDRGRIRLDGIDITALRAHQLASAGISRTYQNVRLFYGLTVLQTVTAGFHRHRSHRFLPMLVGTRSERAERKEVESKALHLLDRVGVDVDPATVATNLSYGDQRRVEIARALATDPKVLMLDEPTAGMNDSEAARVAELIQKVRDSGTTVVLVEHNIGLVLDHCDRAAVLNFGTLIAQGSPRDCVGDPKVREAYFGRSSNAERIETLLRVRPNSGGH